MNNLGERIAHLRSQKGLSQRNLMEVLNFDNLSKYEKNQRQPNYEVLIKIASFFNVSVDWLLTGKEKNIQPPEAEPRSTLDNLSDREASILQLFRQLDEKEQIKIEGMLEMKVFEAKEVKRGRSSNYRNGEEAAAKEMA